MSDVTLDRAVVEARRRWGPQGHAWIQTRADGGERACVGQDWGPTGREILGEGETFAEAFDRAPTVWVSAPIVVKTPSGDQFQLVLLIPEGRDPMLAANQLLLPCNRAALEAAFLRKLLVGHTSRFTIQSVGPVCDRAVLASPDGVEVLVNARGVARLQERS